MPKPLTTGDSATILAFCKECNEPRYRSVRPLVVGKDSPAPNLFVALDPEGPPPSTGKAVCFVCQSSLLFVPEETQQFIERARQSKVSVTRPELNVREAEDRPELRLVDQRTSEPLGPPPQTYVGESGLDSSVGSPQLLSPLGVRELFRIEDGEAMTEVQDLGHSLLIVTTRRVVEVSKGA